MISSKSSLEGRVLKAGTTFTFLSCWSMEIQWQINFFFYRVVDIQAFEKRQCRWEEIQKQVKEMSFHESLSQPWQFFKGFIRPTKQTPVKWGGRLNKFQTVHALLWPYTDQVRLPSGLQRNNTPQIRITQEFCTNIMAPIFAHHLPPLHTSTETFPPSTRSQEFSMPPYGSLTLSIFILVICKQSWLLI